jgi:hypothetical protein
MDLQVELAARKSCKTGVEGEGEMNDRFSLSIFTIEVDGKPTIVFEA